MSSKNLNFIDRLRSKSFDKAIITGNNLSSYHYIENFDNVTEDECLKIDSQNKEIYKKNMDLYEQISKRIENKNAMFKIDSPPMPPSEPNNYDRFISHRLRNVSRNVRYQTYAVNYLLNKGYKLIFTINHTKTENEFEPHEAIDICEKLETMTIDNILKKEFPNMNIGHNSPNVYNNRKSMNINHVLPPNYYPVYPSEYYQYQQCIPSTPSTPMTHMTFNLPNQTSIQPSAPPMSILSSSAPAAINTQNKQIINAPPASHYIHRD